METWKKISSTDGVREQAKSTPKLASIGKSGKISWSAHHYFLTKKPALGHDSNNRKKRNCLDIIYLKHMLELVRHHILLDIPVNEMVKAHVGRY